MNRSFACVTVISLLTSVSFSQVPTTQENLSEQKDCRKILPSTILNGMANSCTQLGKVAAAKDTKEKQQETCNLIASFFQLAADASKENEKNGKSEVQDVKEVKDKTVDFALEVVNVIEQDTENELKSEPSLYITMLKNVPDQQAKRDLIEKILNTEKEAEAFLQELLVAVQKIFMQTIPDYTNYLLNYLKEKFNK